eukprot:jgi/Botrbrau1/10668/Bobra.53_2s0023.1
MRRLGEKGGPGCRRMLWIQRLNPPTSAARGRNRQKYPSKKDRTNIRRHPRPVRIIRAHHWHIPLNGILRIPAGA